MTKAAFLTCMTIACVLVLSGAAGAQTMEQMRAVYAQGRFVEAAELGAAIKTSASHALAARSLAMQGHFFAKGDEKKALFERAVELAREAVRLRYGQSRGAHPTGPCHGPICPCHRVPVGGSRGLCHESTRIDQRGAAKPHAAAPRVDVASQCEDMPPSRFPPPVLTCPCHRNAGSGPRVDRWGNGPSDASFNSFIYRFCSRGLRARLGPFPSCSAAASRFRIVSTSGEWARSRASG